MGTGRVIALDDDPRRLVERSGAEAGVPAARPSARALPRAVRAVHRRGRPSARSSTSPTLLKVESRPRRRDTCGERRRLASSEPCLLELTEHGVYEIRVGVVPRDRPDRIAVNLDPAESDLAPIDPQRARRRRHRPRTQQATATGAPPELTPEEAEKRQSLWWYLLWAACAARGRNRRRESAISERSGLRNVSWRRIGLRPVRQTLRW